MSVRLHAAPVPALRRPVGWSVKPLLVGEANPYSRRPDDALLPWPEGASGHRLSRLLGLSADDYVAAFERRNLCGMVWDTRRAREEAVRIEAGPHRVLVLLGSKVRAAFGVRRDPFTVDVTPTERVYVHLPHPSGRSREWHRVGAAALARRLVSPYIRDCEFPRYLEVVCPLCDAPPGEHCPPTQRYGMIPDRSTHTERKLVCA